MYHLLMSMAMAYGCAIVTGWLLRKKSGFAVFVALLTVIAIALSLLIVPSDQTILRGLAAFPATDLLLKVVDYRRHLRRAELHDPFANYLRFLIPFPLMLAVRELKAR